MTNQELGRIALLNTLCKIEHAQTLEEACKLAADQLPRTIVLRARSEAAM